MVRANVALVAALTRAVYASTAAANPGYAPHEGRHVAREAELALVRKLRVGRAPDGRARVVLERHLRVQRGRASGEVGALAAPHRLRVSRQRVHAPQAGARTFAGASESPTLKARTSRARGAPPSFSCASKSPFSSARTFASSTANVDGMGSKERMRARPCVRSAAASVKKPMLAPANGRRARAQMGGDDIRGGPCIDEAPPPTHRSRRSSARAQTGGRRGRTRSRRQRSPCTGNPSRTTATASRACRWAASSACRPVVGGVDDSSGAVCTRCTVREMAR